MPSTEKGIVVRLPGETRERIAALARSHGRSMNFVLNEAVDRYVAEEAWLIDEIAAAVAEADVPDALFVPQSEVMAGLDAVIASARQRQAS